MSEKGGRVKTVAGTDDLAEENQRQGYKEEKSQK